jgi:serine acetyltransferase
VLLGTGVSVLGKVTVGENSKIGAGSMVVDNIPPNCVAGEDRSACSQSKPGEGGAQEPRPATRLLQLPPGS